MADCFIVGYAPGTVIRVWLIMTDLSGRGLWHIV